MKNQIVIVVETGIGRKTAKSFTVGPYPANSKQAEKDLQAWAGEGVNAWIEPLLTRDDYAKQLRAGRREDAGPEAASVACVACVACVASDPKPEAEPLAECSTERSAAFWDGMGNQASLLPREAER